MNKFYIEIHLPYSQIIWMQFQEIKQAVKSSKQVKIWKIR